MIDTACNTVITYVGMYGIGKIHRCPSARQLHDLAGRSKYIYFIREQVYFYIFQKLE